MISTKDLLPMIRQAIKDAGIDQVFIQDTISPVWDGREQLNIYEESRTPVGHQQGVCGYRCTVYLQCKAKTMARAQEMIKTAGAALERLTFDSNVRNSEELSKATNTTDIDDAYNGLRQYTVFTIGE